MKRIKLQHFIFLAVFLAFSCNKKSDLLIEKPVVDQDASVNKICHTWNLVEYTIETNAGVFNYDGPELNDHALKTLTFLSNGKYLASDPGWSGIYLLINNNTTLAFIPADSNLISFQLDFEGQEPSAFALVSPWVRINPEADNSSLYDQFVAYEAKHWLQLNGINTYNFKSVRIRFRYSLR